MLHTEQSYFNRFIIIPLIFPLIYCGREFIWGLTNTVTEHYIIFGLIILFTLCVIYIGLFVNLKLQFHDTYFTYNFWPFVWNTKRIEYTDILSWELIKIDPLTDFLGWGYKKSKKYGWGMITDTDRILRIKTPQKTISFSIKNHSAIEAILERTTK